MVRDQLAGGFTLRTQGALRPLEPPPGLIEPSEPHEGDRSRGQGGEDDRILPPAVRVCDPHRLLAELKPLRQRRARQRAGDPEVTRHWISRPGRRAPRANSSACSRCRLASSTRVDHSSATPRFCAAELRASLNASASSASAATTSSGNVLRSWQIVPQRPSRVRSSWWSANRREARGQSRAACACRIASAK